MGIAKVLTDAGATVYNLDRDSHGNDEEITGKMIDIQLDLLERDTTKKVINDIINKEGQLDFLINNAGITFKCRAEEFPMEYYHKIQDLNLETILVMSQLCYPYLKNSKYIGRIISISSMAAYMGFSEVVPYCMTKSGVTGLTRGLAEEWKNDNILVNSVAPGWFLTKLNEGMFEQNPDRKKAALSKPMLGKFGYPIEIGYMILFLLSKASTYLTGHDFAIDGGAITHGF
jgi:2-deoxy-D-gluconate 3-dehydrogenase